MNKRFFILSIIAFTVVASGCTGGVSEGETPEENTAPSENVSETATTDSEVDRTITVSGGNYYFEPDTINVSVNENVRFVFENEGGMHDMRIPELGAGTEVFRGGDSQSFTVKFEETGSYEFICSVGNHAEQGMRGTIQVS